jgi:predicted tellurium resistance membrane protein TerC
MEAIAALIALTAMEIVLGIDNVVFIAIVASKLPAEKQLRVRLFGLAIALLLRLGLLFTLKWLMGLTKPFATIAGVPLSGKSIILLLGGLFLMWSCWRCVCRKSLSLSTCVNRNRLHRRELF